MKKHKYDYLIVGAGLFGATFAYLAGQRGKKCLVIDKRPHLGGNLYCEKIEGINVHKYGPHIFHTSDKKIWDFVNSIVEFNRFTYCPVAKYKNKIYSLPFNMNTFYQLWGISDPNRARKKIEEQKNKANKKNPRNLEEQAISLVGTDIYKKLIKGYTEKQWGRKATELPNFIIKRLPVRFTFDNNYFNDSYQGVPIGGYNKLISGLLKGSYKKTGIDYFSDKKKLDSLASDVVFTGKIDEYFNYSFGKLEYRSLRFEESILNVENFQGNAGVNYTDLNVPFTRIVEHKHFEFGQQPKTVITKEYPQEWKAGKEPFYPINDEKNNKLYLKYFELSKKEKNVIFGGRLAEYKYYDMDKVIEKVFLHFKNKK